MYLASRFADKGEPRCIRRSFQLSWTVKNTKCSITNLSWRTSKRDIDNASKRGLWYICKPCNYRTCFRTIIHSTPFQNVVVTERICIAKNGILETSKKHRVHMNRNVKKKRGKRESVSIGIKKVGSTTFDALSFCQDGSLFSWHPRNLFNLCQRFFKTTLSHHCIALAFYWLQSHLCSYSFLPFIMLYTILGNSLGPGFRWKLPLPVFPLQLEHSTLRWLFDFVEPPWRNILWFANIYWTNTLQDDYINKRLNKIP